MKQMTVHLFEPDRDAPPDHRGDQPCRHCSLPRANRSHRLPDAPPAQVEHRRRIGDED